MADSNLDLCITPRQVVMVTTVLLIELSRFMGGGLHTIMDSILQTIARTITSCMTHGTKSLVQGCTCLRGCVPVLCPPVRIMYTVDRSYQFIWWECHAIHEMALILGLLTMSPWELSSAVMLAVMEESYLRTWLVANTQEASVCFSLSNKKIRRWASQSEQIKSFHARNLVCGSRL